MRGIHGGGAAVGRSAAEEFLCIRLRSRSRVDEESLGRGRQSVAHGVVAAITEVRAVDDSMLAHLVYYKVVVVVAKLGSGLADGSRQRARLFLLSDASALKRARAAAAATAWMRKERCLRVAQEPSVPASKRSPSSSALSASP